KPKIGPEYTKSKNKFTKIMEMLYRDIRKIPDILKIKQCQDCHCKHRYKPAGCSIPGKQGTVPMSINGHNPQPYNYCRCNRSYREKTSCIFLDFFIGRKITRFQLILFDGQSPHLLRKEIPNS